MAKWIYDGYTKVHDDSRKHMIEKWCYRCSECGHIVRTEPKRTAILTYNVCPHCGADMRGEQDGNT